MKKYFAQLRPMERRLAVAVLVVVIIVLNWVYVWPHFSDWGRLQHRLDVAQQRLVLYQKTITDIPTLKSEVGKLENLGEAVPPEEQAFNFMRLIQQQAVQSQVGIVNSSRPQMHTNDAFFVEQVQNLTLLATDDQLVDFLYKLGSGGSMIRVRGLELQPDPAHQHLNAQVQLVASYQKAPAIPATKSAPAKPEPAAAARPAAPAPGSATGRTNRVPPTKVSK